MLGIREKGWIFLKDIGIAIMTSSWVIFFFKDTLDLTFYLKFLLGFLIGAILILLYRVSLFKNKN